MSTLRDAALSGLAWSGAGRLGQKFVTLVISVLLARMLVPADFGLVGMTMVFMGFANSLSDFGLSQTLVQRETVERRHLNTVFLMSTSLGTLLMGTFLVCAPWIEEFYEVELVADVTRALSLTFLLRAVSLVPRALLVRSMDFRKLAAIDLVAAASGGIIGLVLAAAGSGVWSLIAQAIADAGLGAILVYIATRWRPRGRPFDSRAFFEIVGFSANLTGFNVVNYWARNLDNLLIGRVFGADALGLYSRAYAFMVLPINQVNAVSGRVMIRTLSLVQDDEIRHQRIYLRASRGLTLLTFPVLAGLLASADAFVLGVLGPQWKEMIPVLRLLSVAGLFQVVVNPLGWIYVSKGRTDWMFRWALIAASMLMVAISVGVLLGSIEWVAVSYLAATAVLFYPGLMIASRVAGFSSAAVVRCVAPNLASALAMATVVFGVGSALDPALAPLPRFGVQVVTGVASYAAVLRLFRPQGLQDLVEGIRFFKTRREDARLPSTHQGDDSSQK